MTIDEAVEKLQRDIDANFAKQQEQQRVFMIETGMAADVEDFLALRQEQFVAEMPRVASRVASVPGELRQTRRAARVSLVS